MNRQNTKIILLGADGYIGRALFAYLEPNVKNYDIRRYDNFSRRSLVREVGSDSLFPLPDAGVKNSRDGIRYFDATYYPHVYESISSYKPDVIIHLAEQPSAPYSMRDAISCVDTQKKNIVSTLNVLWAMRDCCPEAHLIKLGTMGEYGDWIYDKINIPESSRMVVDVEGSAFEIPTPKWAGSFYHWCYDDKTEVLTNEGWKLFKNIKGTERIATLNPDEQVLEYQNPTAKVSFDYDGKMYCQKNKRLDICVTPNHKLFVGRPEPKRGVPANLCSCGCGERAFPGRKYILNHHQRVHNAAIYCGNSYSGYPHEESRGQLTSQKLIPAEDVKGKSVAHLVSAEYKEGKEKKIFVLPACYFGKNGHSRVRLDPKIIPMDTWLKFMGWYLSEGHTCHTGNHYGAVLSSDYELDKAEKILEDLDCGDVKRSKNEKQAGVSNKQLGIYLRRFGRSGDKFIPKTLKNLSIRQLKILLFSLIRGDGHLIEKDDGTIYAQYYTISTKLADDVQEIALKCGYSASKTLIKNSGYCVNICEVRTVSCNCAKATDYYKDYKGKVHCLEVPNGVLLTRRNGKQVFCGNSKVFDSYNIEFACKLWELRATDINQGPVYGTRIDEMSEPRTRFDYDSYFGTVVNRFVVQSILGIPLTVYGKGGQTRGYINLNDSVRAIELIIQNPPEQGEFNVINQITEVLSVNDIALLVSTLTGCKTGVVKNPRKEREVHTYKPVYDKLRDMGLTNPRKMIDVIPEMVKDVEVYKGSIIEKVILPDTKWR